MGSRGPKARPVSDRFQRWVEPMSNGCIEWRGTTNGVGYGTFRLGPDQGGRRVYTHRWAYEQRFGPIPEGLHLDHLCRNRCCCNPDHLEPVTPQENVRRGFSSPAQNARKTHCLRGHELSGENLYISPTTGCRSCVTCRRRRDRLRGPEKRRRAAQRKAAA